MFPALAWKSGAQADEMQACQWVKRAAMDGSRPSG